MPSYRYRAVHPSGRIHRGGMTAANENELIAFLKESGLELIEAKTLNSVKISLVGKKIYKRITLHDRVLLCRQLSNLLRSGLPFMVALQGVIASLPSGHWRGKIEEISRAISQGHTVASAFGLHPDLFSPVFLAILKAGETSGDLSSTFDYLAKYVERQLQLYKQTKRALRYPLFLLCIALGVIAFMMTMVVPQVTAFLENISNDLPFLTRMLISVSHLFAENWWMLSLLLITSILVFTIARRHSESFVLRTDKWLLKIPGIGNLLANLAIARFAHSFALLLKSGEDISSALLIAKNVLGNHALIAKAAEAERQLTSGQSFSSATSDLFPPFVTQMIKVGEQSGHLIETLEEVSCHYTAEAQSTVEKFINALEPALTILVGTLLAWIALAVLGPVYSSLGKLNMVP